METPNDADREDDGRRPRFMQADSVADNLGQTGVNPGFALGASSDPLMSDDASIISSLSKGAFDCILHLERSNLLS